MTDQARNKQVNELLTLLTEELDISEAKYEEAEKRYKAIATWLSRPESVVKDFEPEIYVQGSFRLGTVIKPMTEDGEYDIDSVCTLKLSTRTHTQEELKRLVGSEIKAYVKARPMNKPATEGKRCWTINYADESRFHMDILPAVPNAEYFQHLLERQGSSTDWNQTAISITDNTLPSYCILDPNWPVSNPKGYADWFIQQMKEATDRSFSQPVLMEKYASIEQVPTYAFKTPLQRVIQIMKRHRDIMFEDSDDKPISIIISTLAAHAYNNEDNIIDALVNISNKMLQYIETKNGETWIQNPVNPLENFADKWPTHPQRKECFYHWYTEQNKCIASMMSDATKLPNFRSELQKIAGDQTSQTVIEKYGQTMHSARGNGILRATTGSATLVTTATTGSKVKGHTFYGR